MSELVVDASHERPRDKSYHDVMDALSGIYWQDTTQLAMSAGCSTKESGRVVRLMDRAGLLERNGNAYRFEGYSNG